MKDADRNASFGQEAPVKSTSPGVIAVGELYRLDEARNRLGWSESALRAAKRRGLRLLVCGKRRYVTGDEILRFLESIQQSK